MPVYHLKNVIQPYAWGSRTAIAGLLGKTQSAACPEAELWMGTHPKGSSSVMIDNTPVSLAALIAGDPDGILGPAVSRRFDGRLPFLFKVLAADQPLSIQAHPDQTQAREGFSREHQQGKAMDAPDRNYRDPHHKPELICALTPFWALKGFRPVQECVALLSPIFPAARFPVLDQMRAQPPEKGLRFFFETLMTLKADEKSAAWSDILKNVNALKTGENPVYHSVYQWIRRLAEAYPNDMGALAPAFLNLIHLSPGQALYLPAGELHAYLKGLGIELMASSDNVLRGGLTPKHVDVPELMRVVRFEPADFHVLTATSVTPGESRFFCPAAEFSLSVIHAQTARAYHSPCQRNVEILLCTEGQGVLVSNGKPCPLKKGDSVLVPASLGAYQINGDLALYKATVPDHG